MDANERECLVKKVIGAVYEVSNVLGAGFLEKVYERARDGRSEPAVRAPIRVTADS